MLLFIDNYDSFTYNLVHALHMLIKSVKVVRNDEATANNLLSLSPSHIVVGPGPGNPETAGISMELIRLAYKKTPILGVCLGHQCIAQVFGGKVKQAPKPVHGQSARIHHDGKGVFRGVSQRFHATRYHSLVAEPGNMLKVSAKTDCGLVMGLRHPKAPTEGVQFHPESVLTTEGMTLFNNFINQPRFNNEKQTDFMAHVGSSSCELSAIR